MADYRLYKLQSDGRIDGPADIHIGSSDAQAVKAARDLGHDHPVEIWHGQRKVDTVVPRTEDDTPPDGEAPHHPIAASD